MKTKDRFGRNRIGESIRLNRSKFTQTTGPVIDLFPNSSHQGEESGHISTSGHLPRELADRTQFKSAPRAVFSIRLHVILQCTFESACSCDCWSVVMRGVYLQEKVFTPLVLSLAAYFPSHRSFSFFLSAERRCKNRSSRT